MHACLSPDVSGAHRLRRSESCATDQPPLRWAHHGSLTFRLGLRLFGRRLAAWAAITTKQFMPTSPTGFGCAIFCANALSGANFWHPFTKHLKIAALDGRRFSRPGMEKEFFMQACRQGGRQVETALVAMYRDYSQALWREAWRHLGDAEAARDLLQDTLLKAWQACSGFRGDSELYPWLVVILRRRAFDQLRSRRPEEPLDDDQGVLRADVEQAALRLRDAASDEPGQQLMAHQREAVFRRCAERFAAEHPQAAQVIRWLAEDDLSPADIAELTGRTPGAAREFISQCRKKARHYFADWHALATPAPEGS
jgi:RNA polymerase sigma factor (sigma-70 family)